MSDEDTMVPYMQIYSIDPFSGTQVLTGAMIMDGRTIRYIGRSAPFKLADGPFKWLCQSHAESLSRQQHPWDIGPNIACRGRWWFSRANLRDGAEVDAWLQMLMEKASV